MKATRTVLLDTNLLIGALEPEDGNAQHQQAGERLRQMLVDPGVKLAISPLIRFEVLRGVRRKLPVELEAVLNGFQEFEVRSEDARRAAEIFRLANLKGKPLDKRTFDVFHFVCAELNNLEFNSQDGDIPRIRELLNAEQLNA